MPLSTWSMVAQAVMAQARTQWWTCRTRAGSRMHPRVCSATPTASLLASRPAPRGRHQPTMSGWRWTRTPPSTGACLATRASPMRSCGSTSARTRRTRWLPQRPSRTRSRPSWTSCELCRACARCTTRARQTASASLRRHSTTTASSLSRTSQPRTSPRRSARLRMCCAAASRARRSTPSKRHYASCISGVRLCASRTSSPSCRRLTSGVSCSTSW
mmetsp:Transcript_24459/g.63139  ORF Transcript_24459/g.63139 Transcript_24459/m.63139 type:complete len:216 (+) Transcript_24459:502-1149(+)